LPKRPAISSKKARLLSWRLRSASWSAAWSCAASGISAAAWRITGSTLAAAEGSRR